MPHASDRLVECITSGFEEYRLRFGQVTRRAADRFRERAWREGQEDARTRILLYGAVVRQTLDRIRSVRAERLPIDGLVDTRESFARWARRRSDCEIAETFYNSVIRRLNGTVGVDPRVEFVGESIDDPAAAEAPLVRYPLSDGYLAALTAAIDSLPFPGPWHEREARLRAAAARLAADLGPEQRWRGGHLEVLEPVFYRNKGAYVVGRVVRAGDTAPVILAVLHPPEGVVLDAVLTTSDDASVVFGFTRSYLHADLAAPKPVIDVLRSIMPLKRVDELYTAIGFNRHGKTEFYRTLRSHLGDPGARFRFTPGKKGLVMSVFTLPELNVVFKVIRDQFGAPKKTTPHRVRRNYGLIFIRDRVGRLADAQEFERLELPRDRFDPEVLDTLLMEASRTARLDHGTVIIDHLYTERRVRPLDLYLDEVDEAAAAAATLDFGQAIKDLAAADIFPGDMLIKNFGVTRHGRVIFYDYDEVAPLTRCNFRDLPEAAYPEAELAASPPFYVGPDDVFPEEWRPFLGPRPPLRQLLHAAHPELFDPEWWRDMQRRQREGEVVDFFPYPKDRRLA